jgi:hypothetical protein
MAKFGSSLLLSCGATEWSADAEEVGTLSQGLVVAEHSVVESDGFDFTESAGGVIKVGTSWQTVVVSNIDDGSVLRRDYGCWRKSFQDFRAFNITSTAPRGFDPSVATDWNGTNEMFTLWIDDPGGGTTGSLRLFRSSNPCPPTGNPTWNEFSFPNVVPTIDFPTLIDDIGSEDMWYVAHRTTNGVRRVIVGRFDENSTGIAHVGPYEIPSTGGCPASDRNVRSPRGIMVGTQLWLTYRNSDDNTVEFIKFNTTTNTFLCNSTRVVDYAPIPAPVTCGTCTSPTWVMPTVADGCKKFNRDAKIDVSDPGAAMPVAVVTWSESGSSCPNELRSVIARSVDGGDTWSIRSTSGCKTGVHSSVSFARTPEHGSTLGVVNVVSMRAAGTSPSGGSGLRPYRLRSTDYGDSWVGNWFGSMQTTFPSVNGVGSCYWGDYDGLVSDNASNVLFAFWGDGDNGGNPDWEIRGQGSNL